MWPSVLFERRRIASLLLSISLCGTVFGQTGFVAIQPEQAAQYRFNFARNFFASPEAERTNRASLYSALKLLEDLKGKVAATADNLQRAIELNDEVQTKFARHYYYLYLRYAVDTRDTTSRDESNALNDEVNARTAFVQQEMMQVDDRTLSAFTLQKPALQKYLFAIETSRRYRPHTLSLGEEELLSATATINSSWQYDLYENLIAHTRFGTVRDAERTLDVWRQRAEIANSTDRAVRESGFKQRYAGFAAERDLYAFTLMRLAAAGNLLARMRHYEDAPTQSYFGRYWTRPEVNNLLEEIARHADLYKRYQRLRAEHAGKIAGYEDVNVWDLSVRPAGAQLPRFTILEASQVIRDALAPLGAEYGRELAALLDSANGRMDIVPGEHRKGGGFSVGFSGMDSLFYSGGFAGYYNDMRVLAHESTHAVQRQLMNRNHVPPAYYAAPSYFSESFAIFNELLLPDYLYNHERDPLRKQYFLEQFLDGKGMQMFTVAPEAMLEQEVYDGCASGRIRGADDLDALTRNIYSRFSIWPARHDELKNQWMSVQLMYEDPFYDINYVYGALLALKYYAMYRHDAVHFIPRYIELMGHGFDQPPAVLLKRFLDIDLNDPRLMTDAFSILEEKVNLLEESYRR
ncbi:MAG TPA: M3 family metallopeptidase [Pyrinomonadaceae bacterium]|nr:M3 family metallopeptidase [Pyrinomonadaceae bacterium]